MPDRCDKRRSRARTTRSARRAAVRRRDSETAARFALAFATEFRHESWFDEEVFACLRERNCALCLAEMENSENYDLVPTANWGYLRLRRSDYTPTDLRNWKQRILSQPWDHAYVFFKHEDEGIGPKLAGQFLELGDGES